MSWALSRFKKDGLGNAWVGSLPSFLRFVGVTRVDPTNLRITSFFTNRRSSLEHAFFSDVTFYDIIDPTVIPTTHYMQCSHALYTQCVNTFKTTQDYQRSSNSTYMPHRKCIDSTSEDVSFHHCPFLSSKKHSSGNSFIQLEKKFKYLKDNTYTDIGMYMSSFLNPFSYHQTLTHILDTDKLVHIALNHTSVQVFKNIVVSVCSGQSETEMQSQMNLCICLDTNKKSLFASKFIYKYSPQPKGSNVLLHYFDMSKGLLQLLNSLSSRCHLPIIVLFQHPSPSPEKTSRNAIATAYKDCMHVLVSGYMEEIHYVFDYNPSKNTWTGDKLQALTHSLCEKHIIDITCTSHTQTISENGDETVRHPIFGVVNRRGWALMKKGHEMAFVISKNKNKD